MNLQAVARIEFLTQSLPVRDQMMNRLKAEIAIEGDGLIVIAPGIECDGLAAARLLPLQGGEDQRSMQSPIAIGGQYARSIDVAFGGCLYAALRALFGNTEAGDIALGRKHQEYTFMIESRQPRHGRFAGLWPIMPPSVTVTLPRGYEH